MYNFQNICAQVCVVARSAGEYIARESESFSAEMIEQKGRHNLVSYVDRSAEMMIVEKLRELFPDGEAGFITEEGGAICNGERMRWIIDPLDGTTNFIHGLPPYCVSIALMDGQEVVVGVVYEVTHSELFCAWQGSEAFLNGKPIRASKATKVDNALIAIGFSYAESARSQEWLDRIKTYQENSDGVRRLGSAAADAVYVACGRFDAFVQSGLAAWDIAAAALIVERAGARVSDFGGGSNYIFGGEFIAAAPLVYDEFMTTVR